MLNTYSFPSFQAVMLKPAILMWAFVWMLYPSFVGAIVGLAAMLSVWLCLLAIIFGRKQLAKLFAAVVIAYVATTLTTLNQYMVMGTNPYASGALVAASGRPFTMFTDDAGMTDANAHEWAVAGNVAIFFAIALVALRPNFRKLLKR